MTIILKQGEAKPIQFTVTKKSDGSAVDLAGATLSLCIKANKTDTECLISKSDGDFDKTDASDGIVVVWLSATNTNQTPGPFYIGELRITDLPTIDKSYDFQLVIIRSVH